MPAKKPKQSLLFDSPADTPDIKRSQPIPGVMFTKAGFIEFDSPITELQSFGEIILARCENDAMFLSQDGKVWQRFIFEITPIKET
ncbi:MAG: hypothetical protein ACREBW_05450 [Candidatus Micrarchaeaceae archaeon]